MNQFDLKTFQEQTASDHHQQSTDDAVGKYIAALHPIELEAAKQDALLFEKHWETYFASQPGPLIVIDLAAVTAGMHNFAHYHGLSIPILEKICNDDIGFAADDSRGPRLTAEDIENEAALRAETAVFCYRNYFHPFFQAGGLVSIDPFNGRRLVSTHAFVFGNLHIAYRFFGLETFYVIIGGIGGGIRFCCFPRLNCLVLANVPGEHEGHKAWSRSLYQDLILNILRHGSEFATISKMPRPETAVALGSWTNLGHFIWQELAGLEEIIEVHGPAAIRHILLGPHTYLPVTEVFPEIASVAVTRYESPAEAFEATLRLPCQHVRPVNVVIRPGLRERIYRVAEAHVPGETKRRIAAFGADKFVFWITLRSHNKSWLRQVDGHIAVVRRLANDLDGLAVILDGWTDTRDAADAIRAALGSEIDIMDTVGCSLYETFLWARIAHLYSSVVSTGLHFTAHFAGCPGVAHGNSHHLRQTNFWRVLAPGSCPPTLLSPSEVRDLSDGSLYDSYDFEPDLLYRRLRNIIDQHYPDRLGR